MSVSVFDHPVLSALLGDDEVAALFTFEAELDAMLAFEAALARAEAAEGLIPEDAAIAIGTGLRDFTPDIGALRTATARDGVVLPELVRQLRAAVGHPHAEHLHFGSTSQDVVDTALVLRLRAATETLTARLRRLLAELDALHARFGARPLMARTRMQAAIPFTVGVRIGNWRDPLERDLLAFDDIAPRVLRLQFGGAVGNLNKLGDKGGAVARCLGAELDLPVPETSWHAERDGIAALANWLALVSGSLGKMGQDIALMAQNEVGEIRLAGAGGSSAMPHKHNPVGAEVLVALARFNATQIAGIHQAMVHENERSGAAWTLEWMVLPQMVVATAAALKTADDVIGKIEAMGTPEG